MQNIKLTLAYDGRNYHGFQKQAGTGLKTIQETIENALSVLLQANVNVIGSGRTDAGVHAEAQVINFKCCTSIPVERFPRAINSLLPADIVVWKAEETGPEFHARYAAIGKTYRYTVYNDVFFSPFWRYYSYYVPGFLDLDKIREAANYFVGTHDFQSFCAKDTVVENFIRTIKECRIEKEGALLKIIISGNGFLYNMVRIIAGTLIEVGKGKKCPEEILSIIQARDRGRAGMTLPPQGLCLCRVEY